MQYAEFKRAGVPRGSGAIESAIRRIINMRMKSNGMFWLEVNAEHFGTAPAVAYEATSAAESAMDHTDMPMRKP